MKEPFFNLLSAVAPVTQEQPVATRFVTTAERQVNWNAISFAARTGLTLPDELRSLWLEVARARLFEDETFGQWGLVLLGPEEAVSATRKTHERRPEQYRSGDLMVGEFLGDSELLVVRCDARASDFGSVIVAAPIDRRHDWSTVATGIESFIRTFIDQRGQKFWQ